MFKIVKYKEIPKLSVFRYGKGWWFKTSGNWGYKCSKDGTPVRDDPMRAPTMFSFPDDTKIGYETFQKR